MRYPKIENHADYSTFFQEFLDMNQSARRSFSLRGFARKIGWPASYPSDLIGGRKRLTLNRALEFAAFAKFDSFETRRLVFMVLEKTQKNEVAAYFRHSLAQEFSPRLHRSGEDARAFAKFDSVEAFAIAGLIRLKGIVPSARKVRALLPSFTSLTEEKIRAMIDDLLRSGAVEVDVTGKAKANSAMLDEVGTGFHWHQRYLENSIRAFSLGKEGVGPVCLLSWFAPFPKSRFDALRAKLLEIRHWIEEVSREALETRTVLISNSFKST